MRIEIPLAFSGERVDRVVATATGLSRSEVSSLIDRGAVRVAGRPVSGRSRKVMVGEVLDVDVPEVSPTAGPAADPTIAVPVVFDDDHVIVVDKPAGLVVHPGAGRATGTLVNGLLARYPELAAVGRSAGQPDRPGIVHRLDRGTSGLLVVARTPLAYTSLVGQLAARTVERRYQALVWGHLATPRGVVDAPIGRSSRDRTRMAVASGGRAARTRYEVEQVFNEPAASLLWCSLETGRTHQIRVHLAAIGHPVVGDARYGGSRQGIEVGRPFLHAAQLSFDHPATGERLSFTAPVPADLAAVLAALG